MTCDFNDGWLFQKEGQPGESVDLPHDAFVSAVMPVNIGQDIDHARLSLQSNAKQTRRSCGCRLYFSAMRFSSVIPA